MKDILEKMKENAEEYGDLHAKDCSCMMEDPDECDCEEMKQIANIIKETIVATTESLSHDIFDNEEQRKAGVEMYLDDLLSTKETK